MSTAEIMERMLDFSKGNIHDIDHLLRVWAYARTIGQAEGLDAETQFILEAAAITHDIACPLCRDKYGDTSGKLQEKEGPALVEVFLKNSGIGQAQLQRIKHLVGHHHTLSGIDGIDYQILVEADYIANASENGYSRENIQNFMDRICRTAAGARLLHSIFCL